MRKQKVVLVLLAVIGVYIFAAGGLTPLAGSEAGALNSLWEPFRGITPYESGLVMMSALFLFWAFILDRPARAFSRTTILEAVSYGSALLAIVLTAVLFAQIPNRPGDEFTGMLALISFLQCFVGLVAASLLICRAESRRFGRLPILINGTLTAAMICLVCLPMLV